MEEFGQGLTALWETRPLLLASVLLLLGASLLGAIYVLRQLRGDTQQAEAWPYRVYRWLQANALGLALVATTLCFAALVALVIGVVWLNPDRGDGTPTAATQPAAPVAPAPPTATSVPFTIRLVDQAGTPLATPTALALLVAPATAPPAPTAAPRPLHPYLLIDPQKADYYADYYTEPNSLPVRFALTSTATLTVTGYLSNTEWLQVCCLATATVIWVKTGKAITLQNKEALPYLAPVTLPTRTPTATALPTLTPTPTAPYLRLVADAIPANLFAGPDETFPHVAQLGPNVDLEINGKTTDGDWLRVCCIDFQAGNNMLWVRNNQAVVQVLNRQALNAWATPVVVPATPVPFGVAQGPQLLGIANNFLTIWMKVYVGSPEAPEALPGYLLAVEFRPKGQNEFYEVVNSNPAQNSNGDLTSQAQITHGEVAYNYKYQYMPAGEFKDGDWQIWLTDALRNRLSNIETFTTSPMQRGVYISWERQR